MTPRPAVRTITDPAVLAALAHPTRRRLMDALKTVDASTVGALAGQLSVAVGSVSHHLKVLQQAGLVTEAADLAHDRRQSWWRLVDAALRWRGSEFDDSPATEAIVAAAASIGLQRQVELARQSLGSARDSALAQAAFSTDGWLMLSAPELDQLAEEIRQVLNRWRDRSRPGDPAVERASVFVFARGFPATP